MSKIVLSNNTRRNKLTLGDLKDKGLETTINVLDATVVGSRTLKYGMETLEYSLKSTALENKVEYQTAKAEAINSFTTTLEAKYENIPMQVVEAILFNDGSWALLDPYKKQ
jgi:hypothetical protein